MSFIAMPMISARVTARSVTSRVAVGRSRASARPSLPTISKPSTSRRALRPLRASSDVPAQTSDAETRTQGESGSEVDAFASVQRAQAPEELEKDWGAVLQYILATALQFSLIRLTLNGLQWATTTGPLSQGVVPTVVVSAFFFFMALKSRIFSPIDNSRPSRADEESKRRSGKRPSWMPPPVVFPIVWSTIGILRTVSAVLIWQTCGNDLLATPLAWFLLHLCIGDTWNTINNVEERRGTSACFVLLVLASVYNAVYQYYQVLPTAGLVLAPSAVWLSIATVLIWTIWSINGKEPFFPMRKVKKA